MFMGKYESYPESKFRWAIKKKTRIYYKPCILPFDVRTVHYFSDIVSTIVEALVIALHQFFNPFIIE